MLKAFACRRPRVQSAVDALARVLGQPRAQEVFDEAALDEGISPELMVADEVQSLHQIASRLARSDGILSVLGLALQIRCETYLALGGPTHE